MGDDASRRRSAPRPGRYAPPGPSVLTPPHGLPEFGDVPDARSAASTGTSGAEIAAAPPVVSGPPPDAAAARALCRCGHPEEAHRHYRRGTDCGACGADACASYRARDGRLRRLLRRR